LASHAASERAREDLVALLMVGVDVLGYGETGRKDVLEAQQLAVGLVVVWRKVIRSPVAGFSMRSPALAMALLGILKRSPLRKYAASRSPMHPQNGASLLGLERHLPSLTSQNTPQREVRGAGTEPVRCLRTLAAALS
jgi:hypothetical protein